MNKLILRLISVMFLMSAPLITRGADVPITPTGPVYIVSGSLAWGISGANGFNNNFFFTPLSQNESVCIYVKNNNPTNLHGFSVSVNVTYNPGDTTPSNGLWANSATSSGNTLAAPSVAYGIGVNISGVAQVSIGFTNSVTQAGNPDTATLTLIQTTGYCAGGANFNLSLVTQTSTVTALQGYSDGLGSGYVASISGGTTNPGLSSVPLHVFLPAATSTKNVYFDRLVISCTATCTIVVGSTTSTGTTCTTIPPNALKLFSTVTAQTNSNTGCTVQPVLAGTNFGIYIIPANQATVIDLKGIILTPSPGVDGLAVSMQTALTGNLFASLYYYEK